MGERKRERENGSEKVNFRFTKAANLDNSTAALDDLPGLAFFVNLT